MQQFAQATAARVIHHAYSGGLLEHTLEVLEYCLKILDVQGDLLIRTCCWREPPCTTSESCGSTTSPA